MRRWLVLSCVFGVFAANLRGAEEARFKPEDLKTLEYIARGYEANAQRQKPIRICGRIFFEQKVMDGAVAAEDAAIISPRWLNYEYILKDGKRRYVQDMMHGEGKKRVYAIDDGRQIMVYAYNVFRRLPLTEEEVEWSDLTGEYKVFVELSGAKGDENVARAMRDLVRRVEEEGFLTTFKGRLAVQLDEQGVFTIDLATARGRTIYKIDSKKGFNLIELKQETTGKVIRKTSLQNEYKQDAEGKWVLCGGQFSYSNSQGQVLQTRKLEVSEISVGDFDCPDSLFQAEGLNMPADITVEDHHFSPPLIIRRGQGSPSQDNIDKLLEARLKSDEMAGVTAQGEVKVQPHAGYVQHQAAGGGVELQAGKWRGWGWFAGVGAAVVVSIAGVVFWRQRRVGA